MHALPESLTPVMHSKIFASSPVALKEQPVKNKLPLDITSHKCAFYIQKNYQTARKHSPVLLTPVQH
jgi:hypothetical protein